MDQPDEEQEGDDCNRDIPLLCELFPHIGKDAVKKAYDDATRALRWDAKYCLR